MVSQACTFSKDGLLKAGSPGRGNRSWDNFGGGRGEEWGWGGDDGKGDKGRGVVGGTSDVRGGWWEVGT